MDRRPLFVVGGAVALLASAVAVRRLLNDPCIRKRIGLSDNTVNAICEDIVDEASEGSFPASDPPSFTATTAGVGA